MSQAMPQASDEDIKEAWAPIEAIIRKTWNILVVGDASSVFTTQDWMSVYTKIVDWHVKGPARPKDPNNPTTGCDEVDKQKFREHMSELITGLIKTEKAKVRPRSRLSISLCAVDAVFFLLSLPLCPLLTPRIAFFRSNNSMAFPFLAHICTLLATSYKP